jgi:hypothetical protein
VRTLAEQVTARAAEVPTEAVTLPAQSAGFEPFTPAWETAGAHSGAHQVSTEADTWAPRVDTYASTVDTEVRTEPEPISVERQQAGQEWLARSLAKARETTEVRTPEPWVPNVFEAVADDARTEEAEDEEAGQQEQELDPVERIARIRKARLDGLSQRKAAQLAQCSPTYVRKVWDADDAADQEAESA